ncbi:MAG: ribosome small subunit-dependent GTPase A [Acidobacteriota bacterium]|nr:ribosome small subunit-dependent GTPase A [Acidobacteriota bacterium]
MNLPDAGWTPELDGAFAARRAEGLEPARVALELNHIYRVWTDTGEVLAEATGKLRHEAAGQHELPAVGDWVALRASPEGSHARIEAILPRKSAFTRKVAGSETKRQVVAANIDTVFLVSALDRDFNPRRVERYLLLTAQSGATPVVILNKADLAGSHLQEATGVIAAIARAVPVLPLSAKSGLGLDALDPYLARGQTVALLGSSGVGKSSIINALAGNEMLKTRAVRPSDDRGRHTSTHRQMVRLPGGALLIDTPGMRELQLWDVGGSLDEAFDDIDALAAGCRFRDCRHRQEPGCAVKAAAVAGTLPADRLEAYLKLQAERDEFEARHDERALIEQKRHSKIMGKALRSRLKEKGHK